MTDRTDRLLSILVILVAFLVISQSFLVPENLLLELLILVVGVIAIGYAVIQFLDAF
jgi:hypothetical protein